jgi:hypothetical protein
LVQDISNEDLVSIIEQSLYQYYLIDDYKFDVRKLIKKVDPDLLNQLESKLKVKVNKENK